MSLHSSLKRAEKLTGSRSVMKRTERIKWLIEKGQWDEKKRVLGLPKIKVIKLKTIKKEKAKEETPAEATAPAPKTTEKKEKE
jgi:small basic protein (TIGR04137 family)